MTEHPIIKCVERSLRYIATQLNEDRAPSLGDVAMMSGISKFHFHRMYKLVTGETCAHTITRLRLARGSAALLEDSMSITEAALVAGYSSSQAFAKAIKRELSENASSLRNDPQRLAAAIRTLTEARPQKLHGLPQTPPIRIETCSLDPLEIILMRTTDAYPDLAQTFGRLVSIIEDPANIRAVLGIPHRDIETFGDDGFVFDCAVAMTGPVENVPKDMDHQFIPSGNYLVVRHTGLDEHLPATLDALYSFILTQADMIPSDAPCIHHYIDDPEDVEAVLCRTDIYVKIEEVSP